MRAESPPRVGAEPPANGAVSAPTLSRHHRCRAKCQPLMRAIRPPCGPTHATSAELGVIAAPVG
jgi:hypothetical protein